MNIRTSRRIQLALAKFTPVVVFLAGAWHVSSAGFARNVLAANLVLFAATGTLAWALFKRSQGKEAAWLGARAVANTQEQLDDSLNLLSADAAMILAACFFTVAAIVQF